MATVSNMVRGVVHGRTIEVDDDLNLPDGQRVNLQVQVEESLPNWLDRFTADPLAVPPAVTIRGTRVLADDAAAWVEQGQSDEQIRRAHPELTEADMDAVRQYAKVPAGLRRSFGGWAEHAEDLDRYLEWARENRKAQRPEIVE